MYLSAVLSPKKTEFENSLIMDRKQRRKVLLLTYYWPPSGGAGVQRWLKMTKYFHEFGWDPIVYCPSNPEAPIEDKTLLSDIHPDLEVIQQPVWEPYTIYKRFLGEKKTKKVNASFLRENKKPKFRENLAVWVRGNFFIPDARKFWVGPSVRFLSNYLEQNKVDAIVSTGPPHSLHLIGQQLHQSAGLPWVADFRDPWTNIDYYKHLKLSGWADRKHHKLERSILETASAVVTVGSTWAKELEELGAPKVNVVMNGFDTSDNTTTPKQEFSRFQILHLGAINGDRNHLAFWAALSELKKEIPSFQSDLELKLIGKNDYQVLEAIEKYDLHTSLTVEAYIPHSEVFENLREAYLLYLPVSLHNAKGMLTGKVYEYLCSRRPIVAVGEQDSDLSELLNESKGGRLFQFDDKQAIKEHLLKQYEQYKLGYHSITDGDITPYSRKSLAGNYTTILDRLTSEDCK